MAIEWQLALATKPCPDNTLLPNVPTVQKSVASDKNKKIKMMILEPTPIEDEGLFSHCPMFLHGINDIVLLGFFEASTTGVVARSADLLRRFHPGDNHSMPRWTVLASNQ